MSGWGSVMSDYDRWKTSAPEDEPVCLDCGAITTRCECGYDPEAANESHDESDRLEAEENEQW